MPKIVLTDEGYNIINTSRTEGGKQFWIGYCGLAYVPEGTALSSNITSLTQDGGDNIYNVFQGSMVAVHAGTDTKVGENSSAYRLANECMYTGNVLTRYRYVLDENDNNRLVVFANSDDMGYPDANHSTGLVEYAVYRNDSIASLDDNETAGNGGSLPLPAPLYYGGEPTSYSGLNGDASVEVTHDTRPYSATAHAASMNPGLHGDAPASADNYDYFASSGNTYSTSMTGIGDALLEKDWQLQSVSNFNRFHAPTNAEGYNQAFEPSCRNMAKATKLFPIAGYDVQTTCPNDDSKVSAVKYTVKIDLRDVGDEISKRSTPYYRYENGTFTLVDASEYKVGFKFNRIGIYAVEASLHAYETASDASEPCARQHLQMQIVGESEPKLVAVMDLPTPIVLSEGGSVEYSCDFIFNFVKPDSGLIDDSAIYYNLYEDDAITWYKNQLIANASTAEAVTSLGVQMNYLRQQISRATSDENSKCGIVDTETDEVANSLAASIAKVAGNLSSVSSTVTENTDNIATLQNDVQDIKSHMNYGANLIDIGYVYHDDSYTDVSHNRYQDPDVELNPMSDEFIDRVDEMLANGCVPFVMYRCDLYEYGHAPTSSSWGTETGEDTPDIGPDIGPDISKTESMIRFAPLVKIFDCAYYFANPMDAGYVIKLQIDRRIQFLKNINIDNWHSYPMS